MKHIPLLALLALSCCLFSCKKDDDNSNPTNPANPTNPYYFKFALDGTNYNLTSNLAQYISSDENEIGGYQDQAPLVYPAVGLSFHYDSTVSDAQVKALAGKTVNFNATNPRPELTFDLTVASNSLYSIDTSNTAFNVKISSVTYLKVDTTIFNKVDVYVLKGTCSGVLEDLSTNKKSVLTDGDFNFLISRVKQ